MDKRGIQVYEGNGPTYEPVTIPEPWLDEDRIVDGEIPETPRFAWVKDKLIDTVDNGLEVGEVTSVKEEGRPWLRWKGRFRNVETAEFDKKLECMDCVWKIAMGLESGVIIQ